MIPMASIHTTAMNFTRVVFDPLAHPEYIKDLRQEVVKMLGEEGSWKQCKASHTKMVYTSLKIPPSHSLPTP